MTALETTSLSQWRDMYRRHKQLIQFVLVGGFAALVNFLARIVLNMWLPYSAAIVVAYLFGMATAFLLNKMFVFREATNRIHHQIMWFTIINVAAMLQTLCVSLFLNAIALPYLGIRWHTELIAHAVGVATPILTSYVGHKRLSFRS
jgi:putative flippase GtrA